MRGTYLTFVALSTMIFTGAGVAFTLTPKDMQTTKRQAISVDIANEDGSACTTCQVKDENGNIIAGPVAEPVAARREHTVTTKFGASRVDPYYWLNEKENPEVVAYLEAENAYAEAQLKPLAALETEIYDELQKRASLPDAEAPYAMDGDFYQARYEAGAEYPVIVRREGSATGPETIVLNVPELAKPYEQYFLRGWSVSPDGTKVAFAVDFKGDRICEIFVRDIADGAQAVSTGIKDASSDMAWATDGSAIFYGKLDEAVRTDEIKLHVLGSDAATDKVIFNEPDTTFSLSIGSAKSKEVGIITVDHLQRTELLAVPLSTVNPQPVVLVPRARNVRAYADHMDGTYYVLTNDGAGDRKILAMTEGSPSLDTATVVVPEVSGHYIDTFALFAGLIAVQETYNASTGVRLVALDGSPVAKMPSLGPTSVVTLDKNEDAALQYVRITAESGTLPPVTYDVDLKSGAQTEVKRSPIWTWYDPAPYAAERKYARAKDGAFIPVTLLYRPDMKTANTGNPTLVYAYGAYGISSDPGFYRNFVTLMDRGFVVAIAHVRGGRDMGDAWYQQGRMAAKMNTFTDFIAVSETLIDTRVADPRRLYANGGSAGGLLMGAIMNLKGEMFDGVVAQVPFVDVLTTMLDDTIPLTTFEYEEWGNPNIPEQYEWMKAYSPYDNVTAKAYPATFVLTGFNDSQVGYFEPAKWVAKLRATKTDENPLLFLCNMGAGHVGNSGRTGAVAERARIYAWLLDRAAKAGAAN